MRIFEFPILAPQIRGLYVQFLVISIVCALRTENIEDNIYLLKNTLLLVRHHDTFHGMYSPIQIARFLPDAEVDVLRHHRPITVRSKETDRIAREARCWMFNSILIPLHSLNYMVRSQVRISLILVALCVPVGRPTTIVHYTWYVENACTGQLITRSKS